MNRFARLKPDPIPAVSPVYEYLAEGRTREIYAEIKAQLEVPWVGVLMLAYAQYPMFFIELWRGLKPITESKTFVDGAIELREFTETAALELGGEDLRPALRSIGYAERELGEVRNIIEIFSLGNFPYVLISTIARMMIEDMPLNGSHGDFAKDRFRPSADLDAPFIMVEEHHASPYLQSVYARIKAANRLPFINSDYRALARWPSYFSAAWDALEPEIGTPKHEALCVAVHEKAVEIVDRLPNPANLNPETVRGAAETDSDLLEVRDVCRLFQNLLPGLTLNVAVFKAQLADTQG